MADKFFATIHELPWHGLPGYVSGDAEAKTRGADPLKPSDQGSH